MKPIVVSGTVVANRPTKKPRELHAIHLLMHAVMAVLVFSATVAADVAVVKWSAAKPRRVQWQGGERDDHYKPSPQKPITGKYEVGMCEDGTLVWRPRE